MSVHHSAFEVSKSQDIWHVGRTEMTSSDKNIIKFLDKFFFLIKSLGSHSEFRCEIVVSDQFNTCVRLDPFLAVILFEAREKVVEQRFPWWIGTYCLSVMLLECVVWELKAFFWSIRE